MLLKVKNDSLGLANSCLRALKGLLNARKHISGFAVTNFEKYCVFSSGTRIRVLNNPPGLREVFKNSVQLNHFVSQDYIKVARVPGSTPERRADKLQKAWTIQRQHGRELTQIESRRS
jgi:hypothetical protein